MLQNERFKLKMYLKICLDVFFVTFMLKYIGIENKTDIIIEHIGIF